MKKQLLAGTAMVVAVAFAAGGAAAAEKKMEKKMMKPSITVNGYFESVVGGILDDNLDTSYSYHGVAAADGNAPALVPSDAFLAAVKTATEDKVKDTSALDTRTDAEIHFNGRAELDSGLKIHARVELEGQNHHSHTDPGGDPIDEYFLSLSGAFGNIILGGTAGAPVRMVGGHSGSFATGVGESLAFDLNDWAGTASGHPANFGALRHIRLDTGDAEKVTYISPSLGGVQVGLTYSPNRENDDGNSRVNAADGAHDGLEAAISYSGKFGEVGIGIGAAMTAYQGANKAATGHTCEIDHKKSAQNTADTSASDTAFYNCTNNKDLSDDLSDWVIAGRLDFGAGFRVSAAYKQTTNDDEKTQGSMVDAGIRYVAGANQFSLTGSHGSLDNGAAEHTSLMGSYARTLGPGVKAHVNLAWTESQSNVNDGTPYTGAVTGTPPVATPITAPIADTTAYIRQRSQDTQSAIVFITGIKVVF